MIRKSSPAGAVHLKSVEEGAHQNEVELTTAVSRSRPLGMDLGRQLCIESEEGVGEVLQLVGVDLAVPPKAPAHGATLGPPLFYVMTKLVHHLGGEGSSRS